jgi:hypothetical protein
MRSPITTVKIELDKERTLRFDFNALALFEEATGLNTLENSMWDQVNARNLRALLWAALRHEDKTLSLEDVGSMISAQNMGYITDKVMEAYKNSASKGDGESAEVDDGKNV